ncbi:hypothetical protein F6Y02_38845 (plasmid) [Bacillus megaterium]|nr:hypothetical protein [Priestia megaterium]
MKQHINTLAVYKKGKIEKQIEFDEYEPSELESELSHFIKTSKELYFEE